MVELKYIYDNDEKKKFEVLLNMDYCLYKSLSVVEVTDAIILPFKQTLTPRWGLGGVINRAGHFIDESYYKLNDNIIFGGKYDYDVSEQVNLDDIVIFMGHSFSHWGSFLLDHIARLWYVLREPNKYKIAYCGIGYNPSTFGDISNQCYEFFNLIGIKKEQLIDIRNPTSFKKVIIPQLSFSPGIYYHNQYRAIYETASVSVLTNEYTVFEKIYFTRTQFPKHKEIGERLIENFFEINGFEIISPEKLNVSEQIFYINNCSVFASLEGTIAHQILFASHKLEKHIVIKKQSEINIRQHLFNQIKGIEAEYIDAYIEPYKGFPISHDDGPFLLDFNKNMLCFAKNNGMEYSFLKVKFYFVFNFTYYTWKCVWKKYIRPYLIQLKKILNETFSVNYNTFL